MKSVWKIFSTLFVLLVLGIFIWQPTSTTRSGSRAYVPLPSGSQEQITAVVGPDVTGPFVATLSPAVRDLPLADPDPLLEREVSPRFQLDTPLISPVDPDWRDPLVQPAGLNGGTTPTYTLSFDGLAYAQGGGAAPSDVNGYIGKDHYIQMINATVFNVYDKNGNLLAGPVNLHDLWTSGGCASSNSGDGIVVYDHLADRWVMAQFRNSFANGFCIAVSTTDDPLGTYYGYEIVMSTFPDYFKLGVWPDAYYVGANQSGNDVHALDRDEMLNGNPVNVISFTSPPVSTHSLLLPSDVDGPPPPVGAPNYFHRFVDAETAGGVDRIEVYEFHVDFDTPGNSSFTGPLSLPSAPFTPLCNFSFSCIRQPGTGQRVDSVTEWPMYRLQYRNFGTHETLVNSHAVNLGGDQSGVRWFELRKTGAGNWQIYQESTLAPDAHSRWMSGIAMDQDGNIAVGYNISSISVFPGVRYATRLATDPLNTLQAEQVLVAGAGSQTGSNRWSDYTSLTVDPVDDCTFWYTAEYYVTTAPVGWRTRIGKFAIPSCGGSQTDMALAKTADPISVILGSPLTYTLTITNNGPITATNVTVTDVLPADVNFISVTPMGSCQETSGTITCTLGTLLDQETATVVIEVLPTQTGLITNTATVAADQADLNLANNTDSVTVPILYYGVALSSDMTATGFTSSTVTYTLQVTNTGDLSDTFNLSVSGQTWNTTLSDTNISLTAGAASTVMVWVDIPETASDGSSDTALITAASTSAPLVQDTALLTTTAMVAPVYGVSLSPNMTATGDVSTTISYQVTVTNTGNMSDTFDLTLTGETWVTTLSDTSLTLDAGGVTTVTVWVEIPPDASDGDNDTVMLTATSQAASKASDSVDLTTTAVVETTDLPEIYLPFIVHNKS